MVQERGRLLTLKKKTEIQQHKRSIPLKKNA